MSFYHRHVLPHLIDIACGAGRITAVRDKVVPLAEGRVLEIGVGSGLNLGLYNRARVSRVMGLDISPELLKLAGRRAEITRTPPFEPLQLDAEDIPLDDASVDTVVLTFTLCSIPHQDRALAEMRRVLRPGGRLLFAEHGLAPDRGVQRVQRGLGPVWTPLAGGCHLDREPDKDIEGAGFRFDWHKAGYLPGVPRFGGYMYWGSAETR